MQPQTPPASEAELTSFLEACLWAYRDPAGTDFDGMVTPQIAAWIAARLALRGQAPLIGP